MSAGKGSWVGAASGADETEGCATGRLDCYSEENAGSFSAIVGSVIGCGENRQRRWLMSDMQSM